MRRNPFIQLQSIANSVWQHQKEETFEKSNGGKKKAINRIEADIIELEHLIPLLKREIEMLRKINGIVESK